MQRIAKWESKTDSKTKTVQNTKASAGAEEHSSKHQIAQATPEKIVVVRIRTELTRSPEVRTTFRMLNLDKKNHAVIIDNRPTYLGMLEKIKEYVTWGKLNSDAEKALMKKKKKNMIAIPLQPPLKGFGRKGIKAPFSRGGAHGNRGDKINDLIIRMVR